MCNEEDEVVFNGDFDNIVSSYPVVSIIIYIHHIDRYHNLYVTFDDLMETPNAKKMGKRPMAEIEGIDLNNMDFSP